jgi:hypothetical protein
MQKFNEAAGYLLAIAALKKKLDACEDIGAGHHALGGRQLTLTFPEFAAVDRAEGTAGGGFDHGKPDKPTLSPDAMLLFLEGNRTWRECIQLAARGTKAALPADAIAAMKLLASEAPPVEPKPKPTDRNCTGQKEVAFAFKRLPKVKA